LTPYFKLDIFIFSEGDSGGPLTCGGALVGITSHGLECALPDYPGIYMDVAYYTEFIMTGASSSLSLFETLKVSLMSLISLMIANI
jgi:secreted trypsin-like serine protease